VTGSNETLAGCTFLPFNVSGACVTTLYGDGKKIAIVYFCFFPRQVRKTAKVVSRAGLGPAQVTSAVIIINMTHISMLDSAAGSTGRQAGCGRDMVVTAVFINYYGGGTLELPVPSPATLLGVV
jgi:hypothetical protein